MSSLRNTGIQKSNWKLYGVVCLRFHARNTTMISSCICISCIWMEPYYTVLHLNQILPYNVTHDVTYDLSSIYEQNLLLAIRTTLLRPFEESFALDASLKWFALFVAIFNTFQYTASISLYADVRSMTNHSIDPYTRIVIIFYLFSICRDNPCASLIERCD